MRGLGQKRVIVKGGASGIGFATASRFLEESAKVVVLDRDLEAGENLQTKLPGLGCFVPYDVSDFDQVQDGIEVCVQAMGGMDVLINNSGISIRRENSLEISSPPCREPITPTRCWRRSTASSR